MSGRFNLALLILFAVLLTGCKTLTVDESYVFQPGQFGDADAPRATTMRYEHIFSEPVDLQINVWVGNQTSEHFIKADEFVKSEITHDVLPYKTERLAITRVEREGAGRPLVLHCGGNASDRYESGSLYAQKIIPFADVMMFDYPGYGDSTGLAGAESLRAANQALAGYINSEMGARRPLILWGHSLGGFVCADMVARLNTVDAIILETTATNADAVSKTVIPWYAKLFVRPRITESLGAYDLPRMLAEVDAPILIMGAGKDKTLPVELSRDLSAQLTAVGRNVTYAEFPKANHISVPTQESFRATVGNFLSSLGQGKQNNISQDLLAVGP